jgi:hypothetical protein
MRQILSFILIICVLVSACKKDKTNCKPVTISAAAGPCGNWGIVVEGTKYPSSNIPDQFKKDGLKVCASYSLFEDMRMCACCGGTWADISSMEEAAH